uniref:Craniofacial development protein 2-like n=1 Tax=Diabrotica virgifera virgifera TaxID=50390 RepID=A0A6P7GDT7_DIAVI
MADHNLSVLGLSEAHWRGKGHFKTTAGNVVYFSGPDNKSTNGVAIIVPSKLNDCVIGYNTIDDRIISLKMRISTITLHLVQVSAPTTAAQEEDINSYTEQGAPTYGYVPLEKSPEAIDAGKEIN